MREGVLLVDKPAGPTSAEVVRRVKSRHRPGRIGHLGTLDPMATGVLPLCIGGATRLAPFFLAESKAYRGTIRLGIRTDTLDVTGRVLEESALPDFAPGVLETTAASLLGEQLQKPPMFSAVRVGGVRLHELARAGQEVERSDRLIRIDRLELHWEAEPGMVGFDVGCSKGTYVRTLAESIGARLGVPAALASLRRTRVGQFDLGECLSLAAILETPWEEVELLEPAAALRGVRGLAAPLPLLQRIAAGQKSALGELPVAATEDELAKLMSPAGQLVAVLQATAEGWTLARVLSREPVG